MRHPESRISLLEYTSSYSYASTFLALHRKYTDVSASGKQSGVTNYSLKAAIERVREKADCYDLQKQKREYFKIGGPDKFYKTYRGGRTGRRFEALD